MRRKLLGPILGLFLIAEIVVAVLIVQANGGFGALANVDVGVGQESNQVQPTKTFDVGSRTATLIVNSDNGKIEVVGNPSATAVTINATKFVRANDENDANFSKLDYQVQQNGDTITVTAKRQPGVISLNGGRVDITISAPPNLVANLKTSNSTINFKDLNSTAANHKLETSNSSINVTNIKAASTLLRSSNGRLVLDGVEGGIDAETSNASIDARSLTATSLRLKSSNASIDVTGSLNLSSNGSINTSNSRINLRLNSDKLPRFDVTTSNSNINFNLPNIGFERKDKTHITTNGTGSLLEVNTSNGSITVERL